MMMMKRIITCIVYKAGGGDMWSFTPTKRGGGVEKFLAILKGGHKKFWGSFYAVAWSFSHIEGGGGCKRFPLFKSGGAKSFTCVERGGRKKFRTRDFPIL